MSNSNQWVHWNNQDEYVYKHDTRGPCPRCGADYEEAVREKILKNRLDEIKTWSLEKLIDYVQANESELMKDMPLDLLLTFPEAEGVEG